MFSCCRANPKKTKQIIEDVCENDKINETDNSKTSDNKKLVIPKITIDNGKTNEEPSSETTTTKAKNEKVVNGVNKSESNKSVGDAAENVTANKDSEEKAQAEAETCTIASPVIENTSNANAKEQSEPATTTPRTADINVDNVAEDVICRHETDIRTSTNSLRYNNNHDVKPQTTNEVDLGITLSGEENQKEPDPPPKDCSSFEANTGGQPKSCLSRHNSTHTSIKKRVNISTHAEIIEPEPLLPLLVKTASMGDDEDDVFSDSVPPPKRDSMCAPYIERDDEIKGVISDTLAYSHGLPEWFNDERINDMGCIEPPVTPVGRDELELKRQRLYEDLLRAAQAAVEHSSRFQALPHCYSANASTLWQHTEYPPPPPSALWPRGGDCDPNLKPSVAENLEILVNRLEKLVERLERTVSAQELDIANRTFDTVLLEHKRVSCNLEDNEKLPSPSAVISDQLTGELNQRIERIEASLSRINERHSVSESIPQQDIDGSLENIPTVLDDFSSLPPPPPALELSMSVLGYQDIVNGPLSQYLALSAQIGGDVAKHADFVKKAFDAQLQYVTLATQCSQPNQSKQMELLKPTSDQITTIQDFRERNRASQFFNHLSAISESIPALGWVCVSPTPGPHVKEMNDAGQFYTNRVLKEWKEKDAKHVEWARAWVQTLTELQQYIKQYHTTGLVWSGKGAAPAAGAAPPPPPIGGCPPPPPPPSFDMSNMSLGEGPDDRSALFAEINQGENITKSLKKVTADMQTHKNPTLRSGPAPFKTPTQFASGSAAAPVIKEPVFTRDGKKWLIEYQKQNTGLLVENAEMNNVVYMFRCEGSTLTVKGKVNNVVLDSCKKCSLLVDSVVASIEFVNCQSVQMQVLGNVPTISIDKTDGCQMYLSKDSMRVEIVSSKSSEMNVMLPADDNGDYTELPLPEQYKTTISGKTLKTVCVDSLG